MSFSSLLVDRGTKDILSTLGPSFIGSTLAYIIFFLSFPSLESLIVISTFAFILGAILNAIIPSLIDTVLLSPKRVSDTTANRISDIFTDKLHSQEINNDNLNKLISNHIKEILRKETKNTLKELRFTHKYTQTNNKNDLLSELKSIQAKEVKIGNYLSIFVIITIILFIPTLLNHFYHILPLLPVTSDSKNVLVLTPDFYSYFFILSIILIIVLLYAIRAETETLREMYRLEINFLLPYWKKFSFEIEKERQLLENQRAKIKFKADRSPLDSIKSKLDIDYKESLKHEVAFQKILTENLSELNSILRSLKNIDSNILDNVLVLFDQEFPLKHHNFNYNENALILRSRTDELFKVRIAVDQALSNSAHESLIYVLNTLSTPIDNKIIIIQALYSKSSSLLSSLDQETNREIIRLYFHTIQDQTLEEIYLAWTIISDPSSYLGTYILNQFKALNQKSSKYNATPFIPISNPRLWIRSIAQHWKQTDLPTYMNDQDYLDIYALALQTKETELSQRLDNNLQLPINDYALFQNCLYIPISRAPNNQQNFMALLQTFVSKTLQGNWGEDRRLLNHIFCFLAHIPKFSHVEVQGLFDALIQGIPQDENPFESDKNRLLASTLSLFPATSLIALSTAINNKIGANFENLDLINWIKIMFTKKRKITDSTFQNSIENQILEIPLMTPKDIELSNLEFRNDITPSNQMHDQLWEKFSKDQLLLGDHPTFPHLVLVTALLNSKNPPSTHMYNLMKNKLMKLITEFESSEITKESKQIRLITIVKVFLFLEKNFKEALPQRNPVLELLRKSRSFLKQDSELTKKIDDLD